MKNLLTYHIDCLIEEYSLKFNWVAYKLNKTYVCENVDDIVYKPFEIDKLS